MSMAGNGGRMTVFLFLGALALAGCPKAPEEQLPKIQVLQPGERLIAFDVTVEPVQVVEVSGPFTSKIKSVLVETGDAVSRGQVLVELDAEPLLAQLARVKAERKKLQALVSKAKAEESDTDALVVETPLGAALRALLESADAEVQMLNARIEQAAVRSPIDGTVERRHVERGQYVQTGEVLLRIVSTDRLMAVGTVPAEVAGLIHPGQPATVRAVSPSPPGKAVDAHVAEITGQPPRPKIVLRLAAGCDLKPGMIARAFVKVGAPR